MAKQRTGLLKMRDMQKASRKLNRSIDAGMEPSYLATLNRAVFKAPKIRFPNGKSFV